MTTLHRVPVYSQSSERLCWEACGRMMFAWRHKNLRNYARKAGRYARADRGLTEAEMTAFYGLLGMRSLPRPSGANLRHALRFSPVVFTSVQKASGHAMVAVGLTGSYRVINPCGVMSVTFGDNGNDSASCSAASTSLPAAAVDGSLGTRIWYW